MKKNGNSDSQDSMIHVRLSDPIMVRRTTLNLTLDVIRLLKRADRIHEIRKRKQTVRNSLTRMHNELKRLSSTLQLKELPGMAQVKKETDHSMEELGIKQEKPKPVPIIKAPVVRPQLQPRPRPLSPLEQEMASIRNKLEQL